MIFTLLFTALLSHPVLATEVYPWEIKCMAGSLDKAKSLNSGKAQSCLDDGKINPTCAEVTDDFCSTLWSKDHKGNLNIGDGRLLSGKSSKSQLSMVQIENLKARLASVPNLPADLRKKVEPIAAEYKAVMAEEKDSKQWYRKLSQVADKWQFAADDVAIARTLKKHPELKNIKDNDMTVVERAVFRKDAEELAAQQLDAKYANNPNWKRVGKVFDEVKEDLLKTVQNMKISDSQKAKMLARVKAVELSLPYTDQQKLGSDGTCGSSDVNAYYSPSYEKFTVCAGLFNSFQSESSLYFVIAHELSHSIDSGNNADYEQSEKDQLTKDLDPLASSNKAVYSCKEWKDIVDRAKKSAPGLPQPTDSLQSLYDCIAPKGDLKAFDESSLTSIADASAKKAISQSAEGNNFLRLGQPTTSTDDGKTKTNPYYMRPDLVRARVYGDQFVKLKVPYLLPPDIFNQSLACATGVSNGKEVLYKDASKEDRAAIFEKALQETTQLWKMRERNSFNYCGRNCGALEEYDLSVNSQEDTADWMAARAFGEYLSRNKDMRSRREASAATTALFCNAPGLSAEAPDLALAEKNHSLESHPDNRSRRLALFNPRNAKLVKCKIDEKDQGAGKCEPK
jgi:hypothetical protein